MTPKVARCLCLALMDNASRLVAEADALFPSPRAQSLVVLAQEELGKAVWIYKAFWSAWNGSDETPIEVPELSSQGRIHAAKLREAIEFGTAMLAVPGNSRPVEIELVRAYAPDILNDYRERGAHEDNEMKKKGFYVDLEDDGTYTVPLDRPLLRSQIWWAVDTVKWLIYEDCLRANVAGGTLPPPTKWSAGFEQSWLAHRGE